MIWIKIYLLKVYLHSTGLISASKHPLTTLLRRLPISASPMWNKFSILKVSITILVVRFNILKKAQEQLRKSFCNITSLYCSKIECVVSWVPALHSDGWSGAATHADTVHWTANLHQHHTYKVYYTFHYIHKTFQLYACAFQSMLMFSMVLLF